MQMVGNRIDAGQWFGQRREDLWVNVHTGFRQTCNQSGLEGIGVNASFDVHDAVQSAQFSEQTLDIDVVVLGQNVVKAGQGFEPRHGFRIDGFVDGWRPGCSPAKPFESVAGVDDLQGHGPVVHAFDLDVTVGMFLKIHEDEGCEFQSTHDNLDSSPRVATTAPRVFDVCDLIRMDAEGVGEQTMAEVHAGFNPIVLDAIVWTVEDVVRHHFEGGQVPSRTSDGIHVSQANARL